jgi:putative membrane protein
VHYVEGRQANEDVKRLIIMGQKLFRFSSVMAVLALSLGIWLWLGYGFSGGWLNAKLGFVGLLLAYHVQSYRYIQQMARDETIRTSLFFRVYNELALFIVIPILILVIVKPF